MLSGNRLDDSLASRAKDEQHLALVRRIVRPADQAMTLEAVDELHSTVMLNQHSGGESPNGRSLRGR